MGDGELTFSGIAGEGLYGYDMEFDVERVMAGLRTSRRVGSIVGERGTSWLGLRKWLATYLVQQSWQHGPD